MREKVLEKYKSIHLTRIAHEILRREKKKQQKSMMQIIQDVLVATYGVPKV